MSERVGAILDGRPLHRLAQPPKEAVAANATASTIDIAIRDQLDGLETEWRRFQAHADCTAFQTFDWLAAWQLHIGQRRNTVPAIVVGRRPGGSMLFLIPLAVTPGVVRRLTFLGDELCDYNAPLLAPDFADYVRPEQFRALWREIRQRLACVPHHRHDLIDLRRLPETVGAQRNPFLSLDVGLHPSGAHLMELHGSWEEFYQSKRSSVTRRRDRTKRKRLAELGEVRMVEPNDRETRIRTMDVLVEQKASSFARQGIANMFSRPGYREFFSELAANPRTRELVHISRLDVGPTWAAINLGLQFRDHYYHVLASYDGGEVARFGPGAAHLRDLISRAVSLGLRRFDFTVGDERYKFEWADTALALYDHVTAVTPVAWLPAWHIVTGRRLKRFVKQNPQLFELFSRARSAIAAFRAPRR
jgi:CelD/BcsL family acetyltransferase involved in cellulose biosynthesis